MCKHKHNKENMKLQKKNKKKVCVYFGYIISEAKAI